MEALPRSWEFSKFFFLLWEQEGHGDESCRLNAKCNEFVFELRKNEWWKSFPHLVKNEWSRCRTYFFVFILDIKMGGWVCFTLLCISTLKLLFSHFECLPVFYPEAALPVCQSIGITLFISFKEMQILLFIWNRCARSHTGLCVQLFVSKIICTRLKGGGLGFAVLQDELPSSVPAVVLSCGSDFASVRNYSLLLMNSLSHLLRLL